MPQPFVITGNVRFSGDRDLPLEARVEAYDRDLPSLERRLGSTPQLLGEAVTDAGRFRITYTLEQFGRGEGDTRLFRRSREQSADLSFRLFDQTGQELSIINIEALNSGFGPDQIIFNAPAELEVNIFVESRREAGDSEYEILIALITPVIEDVPLAELTDEDISFLLRELGIEQQTEQHQRIEWLRRSALLARETDLPIEAFYGWGRKNVPAGFTELAGIPLADLPSVLKKLISLENDELSRALLEAIAEKIIPASLRDRLEDIIRQLMQRDQVLQQVVAQLRDKETEEVLAVAGYAITAFEIQNNREENRGLDITDNDGKFSFGFYVPREISQDTSAREFRFEVQTPEGEDLPEVDRVSINLNQAETETISVRVKIPKPEIIQQQEQLQSILAASPELQTFLRGQQIQTFTDIRRKGGLSRLTDLPQSDPALIRKLDSLADLDRISPDVRVNTALLDKYDSVLAIADTPFSEFVSTASQSEIGLTELKAAQLHINARTQTDLLNNILAGMAANQANGFNLKGGVDNA